MNNDKPQKNILISAIGGQDPFGKALEVNWEEPGPILSFIEDINKEEGISFIAHNVLFSDFFLGRYNLYCESIKKKHPQLHCIPYNSGIDDPTDYARYLDFMQNMVRKIQNEFPPESCQYHIFISPGTPTMQALWIIMVKGGYIDAELWMRRRPHEAAKHDLPVVERLNQRLEPLPAIVRLEKDLQDARGRIEEDKVTTLLHETFGCDIQWPEFRTMVKDIVRDIEKRRPVCILGPSGAGKTFLVERVSDGLFPNARCERFTRCPENLVESELFGHTKGAFTNATKDKPGMLENADGGVLFVDEFADLPENIQIRLLDIAQGKPFRKVGGTEDVKSVVSLAAATCKAANEEDLRSEGKIRHDLIARFHRFYRMPALAAYPRPDLQKVVQHVFNTLRNSPIWADEPLPHQIAGDAVTELVSWIKSGGCRSNFHDLRKTINMMFDLAIENGSSVCTITHVRDALEKRRTSFGGESDAKREFLDSTARKLFQWWKENHEKAELKDKKFSDVFLHFVYKNAKEAEGNYSAMEKTLRENFSSQPSKNKQRRLLTSDPFDK